MTLKKISEFVKMEGNKGRNGADFNPMLVKCILDKETFYRGYYNYGGVESIGEHESEVYEVFKRVISGWKKSYGR